ncbi:unnamed protein product [Cyprideis torosa]|uniref:Uncharacterized protein n=1 Tax=Cyprideis torosa TaxID=163714 RepID=A0A7R8WB62_9CRUS|nr:unnamed protein product [Cyprideis torosa]CAG0891769.1 unnamed protein product [Cyprideis torosa]
MVPYVPFLLSSELETLMGFCFRGFDGANREVRTSVAQLLGTLLARDKGVPPKQATIDEALEPLSAGFIKGGHGGSVMKGVSTTTVREVRVGITYVSCCQVKWPLD